MDNVVEYNRRGAVASASVGSGGGGGGVDDIFRRLGNVETNVSELRSEVSAISATIPHLATAASVSALRSEIGAISAVIPHLATKADLKTEIAGVMATVTDVKTAVANVRAEVADVRTEMASMETKIIKWFIATTLTTAALAFSIAKLVH